MWSYCLISLAASSVASLSNYDDFVKNPGQSNKEFTVIGSASVKVTNTPGSVTSKWKQIAYHVYRPEGFAIRNDTICTCIDISNPSSTNFSLSDIDFTAENCNCSYPNDTSVGFDDVLPQRKSSCKCPGPRGWTFDELEGLKIRTNTLGDYYDCFCSSTNGYLLVKTPTAYDPGQNSTAPLNVCSCPKSGKWTTQQLQLLRANTNFSGSFQDCYCAISSEFSVKLAKDLEALEYESSTTHPCNSSQFPQQPNSNVNGEDCYCLACPGDTTPPQPLRRSEQECLCPGCKLRPSQQNVQQPESHLTVLKLDGPIKELRFGSLWIRLE